MSRTERKNPPEQPKANNAPPPPLCPPRDVVDGIPDRAAKPRLWMCLLLATIFIAWVAFLILVKVCGSR